MHEDIFDKIIAGEIPSYKVYEDQDVLAFLDISQATKGHTLVVPKKHVENIFEYDDETVKHVFSKLPLIAKAIMKSDDSITGINILSNNGKAAGQSVMHSHWHLIPRRDKEEGEISTFPPVIDNSHKLEHEDYMDIAEQIKRNL